MHDVRSSPDGAGIRHFPLSAMRGYDHRPLRSLSGPERGLCVQEVRISRTVGDRVGRVVVTFRLMPTGPEVDVKPVSEALQRAFGADLRDVAERPVAFGLVSLEAVILLDDAKGAVEDTEKAIRDLDGVGTVEVLTVDLV
jgi:elongation factor 1-beta